MEEESRSQKRRREEREKRKETYRRRESMKGGEGRGEKGRGKKERRGEKNLIVRIFYWNKLPYILYMISVLNYTVYFLWTSLNIVRIINY